MSKSILGNTERFDTVVLSKDQQTSIRKALTLLQGQSGDNEQTCLHLKQILNQLPEDGVIKVSKII